jgi:hypothetical protein
MYVFYRRRKFPEPRFEALALDALFRGHDEKCSIPYANFCDQILDRRNTAGRISGCKFDDVGYGSPGFAFTAKQLQAKKSDERVHQ